MRERERTMLFDIVSTTNELSHLLFLLLSASCFTAVCPKEKSATAQLLLCSLLVQQVNSIFKLLKICYKSFFFK
jgi:hypothetical protein